MIRGDNLQVHPSAQVSQHAPSHSDEAHVYSICTAIWMWICMHVKLM